MSLPATPPCQHAWALRITGQKLRDFEPQEFIYAVEPDAEGNLLRSADDAEIHGSSPRVEKKPEVGKSNIGHSRFAIAVTTILEHPGSSEL